MKTAVLLCNFYSVCIIRNVAASRAVETHDRNAGPQTEPYTALRGYGVRNDKGTDK
jgi:hypothetical protein